MEDSVEFSFIIKKTRQILNTRESIVSQDGNKQKYVLRFLPVEIFNFCVRIRNVSSFPRIRNARNRTSGNKTTKDVVVPLSWPNKI